MLAVTVVLPAAPLRHAPVLCPFRRITGRPCPTCGLTRSWQAATHLRPRESIAHHPLGLATLAATAWVALDADAEVRASRLDRRLAMTAVAIWLGVWLARFSRGAR
jgi:hypothetical protein